MQGFVLVLTHTSGTTRMDVTPRSAMLAEKFPDLVPLFHFYRLADREAAETFMLLSGAERWQEAVELVVTVVGMSEADLAGAAHVSRSTVNRWRKMGSRPLASAMPDITGSIRRMILARHA